MSDFLDRVAARALGGEAMLAPRVPSLFEPMQRDAAMPMVAETREAVPPASTPAAAHDEPRPAPVEETPPRQGSRALPPPRRSAPAGEDQAALEVHPIRALVRDEAPVARQRVQPVPPLTASESGLPGREVRLHHEQVHRHVVPPHGHGESGVLLPPRGTVFTAPPGITDRRAPRPQEHRGGEQGRMDREPVVHVSIGRLEVRAGPAPAPAAQRRETARRNAFDDYLRERGKASP